MKKLVLARRFKWLNASRKNSDFGEEPERLFQVMCRDFALQSLQQIESILVEKAR